jgi:hypothetical protein
MDMRSATAGPADAGAGSFTPGASDPDRDVPVHAVPLVLTSTAVKKATQARAMFIPRIYPNEDR